MRKGVYLFNDATMVAAKNKRVMVKPMGDNILRIHLARKLDEGENPKAIPCESFVVRNRIRCTVLNISKEAAEMLLNALMHELKKKSNSSKIG